MRYPAEVQKYIDVLKVYTENDSLSKFHIFHLYKDKLGYPNGYYDARFFILMGYNTETMEFKNLGFHDGMRFYDEAPAPDIIRIFADGSTLIRFRKPVEIGVCQEVSIFG